jgi:hypothetical protein
MKPKPKILGTGGAYKASQALKKSQATKKKRLAEIQKAMNPNTSNK